jgi:hypothetical protein
MMRRLKNILLRKIHKSIYKPGHYYSPIPDLKEVEADSGRLFRLPDTISGLDLNANGQKEFLRALQPHLQLTRFPKRKEGKRYFTENDFFVESDALYYHAILQATRPKKIVEVGSGFSSAVLFDAMDLGLEMEQVHFIEPYPDRLHSLLNEEDKSRYVLHQERAQNIPIHFFESLNSGDILFIDSSHIAKVGSDVNFIIFDILPILKPGVLIHVHDILYPFEYPKQWIEEGRFWNEAYLLKAFLMFNPQFQILLFNSYLAQCQKEFLTEIDPRLLAGGGSIWIQKK